MSNNLHWTPYILKEFNNYLKNRKFSLQKIEILTTTPAKKHLEGVTIFLNEDNVSIDILYQNRSIMLALDILLYEMADPALDIVEITLNDVILTDRSDEDIINIGLITKNDLMNKIIIKLKDTQSLYYEFGCIIYKVYPNKKEDWHLNVLLDEYGIVNP